MRKHILAIIMVIVMCFSVIGCGNTTEVEEENVFSSGKTLQIENFSCKLPTYTFIPSSGKYVCNQQDFKISIFTVLDITSFFGDDEELAGYIGNEVTSMDDVNAFYYNYLVQTLYGMYIEEDNIDDSELNREFKTVNNVNYFSIYNLTSNSDDMTHLVLYVYDNESDNLIEIRISCDKGKEDLIDAFLNEMKAKADIVTPKSYQTEVLVWLEEQTVETIYINDLNEIPEEYWDSLIIE